MSQLSSLSSLRQLQLQIPIHQAILVTNPSNLHYWCHLPYLLPEEREAFLLVGHDFALLFQSFFAPPINDPLITNYNFTHLQAVTAKIKERLGSRQIKQILYEADNLTSHEYLFLQKNLPLDYQPLEAELYWNFRMHKTSAEISKIKKACSITINTINRVQKLLKVGVSENELKTQIKLEFLKSGACGEAFPTIVAFGKYSNSPHHQPGRSRLKKEMPVLIDCGAKYQGYRADITRTIWFGDKPAEKFIKLEKTVLQAYRQAIKLLKSRLKAKATVSAAEIDMAARLVTQKAGLAKYFIHTTGHGVGLDIHEPPSLNSQNSQLLSPGMVITIEPGLYLPQFGYRHENTILIEKGGVKVL